MGEESGGSQEEAEGDGVVIITDASEAGIVDIHDRRPVVLGLEAMRADDLIRQSGREVSDFEW